MLAEAAFLQQSNEASIANGEEAAAANFVAFHKTGYVLANTVTKRCMGGQVKFFPDGLRDDNITLPTVLFLRDGLALARSAFFYHKEVAIHEDWLRDGKRRPPSEWVNDPTVSNYLKEGESYQEFLNRVPEAVGVRAEYLRSAIEYEHLVNDTRTCRASENCMTACLERFNAGSKSYNQTWSEILNFIGFDDSYLDCIALSDLSNPGFRGQEEHAVSRHTSGHREERVAKAFEKVDKKVNQGWLADASKEVGCV